MSDQRSGTALTSRDRILIEQFVAGRVGQVSEAVKKLLVERDTLVAVICEYVEASIHEAGESALEAEVGLLWGPRSRVAKEELQAAYGRLYVIWQDFTPDA